MNLRLCAVLALSPLLWAANPLESLFSPENLKAATRNGASAAAGERPGSIVLRFPAADSPGSIVLPVPEAARDWTQFRTLTFQFVSDSTIRWDLQIRNRKGETTNLRVQPYHNLRVKAALPIANFTRDFLNNRQFKGHWLSSWGNHIDMTQVESVTIRMQPNVDVTLRLGPVALEETEVADEILDKRAVVDEFGQWIGLDWPGKIRSLADLRGAWAREDAALDKPEDLGFCEYGGWKERKAKPTGFFYAAEIEGRWWLVDPDGHLFFSAGPDCVRFRDPTRVTGRELLFAKLPPDAGDTTDFYQANLKLRYGDEPRFAEKWRAKTAARLKAWGFNTVANWSDAAMFEARVPYVTNVSVGRAGRNWQGFPDVYSEEFIERAAEQARAQCLRLREDKHLIGYFIGNEPRWPQRNLVERILADTEPSATQAFVREYLKDKGEGPGTKEALLEALSRRYFQAVCDAIRKADPNHLILGIRWAGSAPEPVLRANDVFDVFSINIYRFEPPREQIERIYKLVKRPVMIGEFHFGAAERGYAPSLVMVKDQAERGAAYQYYVERAAAMPYVVGAHWFQLVDQPVSGRFDGENYNLGLVNQVDIPYPEMISSAKTTHRRMYQVHAGDAPATTRTAKVR